MSADRPAALPEAGYRPPPRLFLDGRQCTVRFVADTGGESRDFDFTALPVSRCLPVATQFDADGYRPRRLPHVTAVS